MNPPRMMILPIGNKQGFTFIEIMVALIVLSVGITAILKAFITSIDQMSHLTNRLYATTILDNHLVETQRGLTLYKTIPFSLEKSYGIKTGAKEVIFQPELKISEVKDLSEIFQIEVTLTWPEHSRQRHLVRTAYLDSFIKE